MLFVEKLKKRYGISIKWILEEVLEEKIPRHFDRLNAGKLGITDKFLEKRSCFI